MAQPGSGSHRGSMLVGVLNWRGLELTTACVRSVLPHLEPHDAIVVVDNGSGADEVDRLRESLPDRVALLALPTNTGVAGGYNAMLRLAHALGHQAALVLNNDVLLDHPGVLDALAGAAGPGVAAVGPVILGPDGDIVSAGGRMDLRWGAVGHLRSPVTDHPYAVPWIDGSALLIRLEAVDAVGGFDEDYFLYWEEVDWCRRAAESGLRCVVVPAARVTHLGSATATSATVERYMLRNALLFARKRRDRSAGRRYVVRHLFRTIPGRIRREGLGRGRAWAQVRLAVAAIAWNVQDARRHGLWRRSRGPRPGARPPGPG